MVKSSCAWAGKISRFVVSVLLFLFLVGGLIWSLTGGNYSIESSVIASGSATSLKGGDFELVNSFGQPGGVGNFYGGNYELSLGFLGVSQEGVVITGDDEEESVVKNNLSQVFAYPVPFKPGKHSCITFTNLTAYAKIKIYTISGEKVCELEETDGDGRYRWDKSKDISSGVYIYVITNNQGEKRKGRVMIIR